MSEVDTYGPSHFDKKIEEMKVKIKLARINPYHKWQLLEYMDKFLELHLESFEKPKQNK